MLARQIGAVLLASLVACSSVTRYVPESPPPGFPPDTYWYESVAMQPSAVPTRPVDISQADFTRALRGYIRDVRIPAPASEWARWQLQVGLQGDWVAEVYKG